MKQKYHSDVKVRLIGAQPFFGPGTAALLRGIAACGSVSAACEAMGLSYSKGRRMLRVMEKELGYPVVQCVRGGVGGGSACVTPQGMLLLEQFTRYEETVRRYAREEFAALMETLAPGVEE